jgi:hypothetical protein
LAPAVFASHHRTQSPIIGNYTPHLAKSQYSGKTSALRYRGNTCIVLWITCSTGRFRREIFGDRRRFPRAGAAKEKGQPQRRPRPHSTKIKDPGPTVRDSGPGSSSRLGTEGGKSSRGQTPKATPIGQPLLNLKEHACPAKREERKSWPRPSHAARGLLLRPPAASSPSQQGLHRLRL